MERLIDCAARTGAEFEIYSCSSETREVKIKNSLLKDAEANMTSGVSLRLIKDGLAGFAYTKNLNDPRDLVGNALASLKAGVEAKFSFPENRQPGGLKTYSGKAEAITAESLLEECARMGDLLAKRTKGQINTGASVSITRSRLINSKGTDLTWEDSVMTAYGSLLSGGGDDYRAAAAGVDFTALSEAELDAAAELFEAGLTEVKPRPGKHKVLFMPEAMHTILWRIQSGASAQSLFQKTTPLAGREGEKVASGAITLRNNPLNDSIPGARAFDDEAVACTDFPIIEKGIFRGFYNDLNYAAKTGAKPTGNGFRRTMWGGDTVAMRPQPYLAHLYFDKGEKAFGELLKEMGTGIVVFGALGAHSGNIPNGDFSIGLAPGLCVENGKISGKAKDTMVSGNIYDLLKRGVAAGCETNAIFGNNPPVLFDGVDVAS
ncbi:MAG: TldD/PmbA family protein [Elusimicrobia bacterium]|nr:TldD/PmbA family protein [Elusimicrobiota bacterium]